MSCQVIRDSKDRIIKVLTPDGKKESEVFKQLSEMPHLSIEQALDAYDEILKKNLQIDLEQSPVFYNIIGDNATLSPVEEIEKQAAKNMLEKGVDAIKVFAQTGWQIDKDGKLKKLKEKFLKYDASKEIPYGEHNLIDYLNEDLVKAYPDLFKGWKLIIENNEDRGHSAGKTAYKEKVITINRRSKSSRPNGLEDFESTGGLLIYGTLAHETQHIIQRYESFAGGGTNYSLENNLSKLIDTSIEDLKDTKEVLKKIVSVYSEDLSENDKITLKSAYKKYKALEEYEKTGDNGQRLVAGDIDSQYYLLLAGEVEARTVQKVLQGELDPNKSLEDLKTEELEVTSEVFGRELSTDEIVYNQRNDTYVESEPNLTIESDGDTYNSFQEAIENTDSKTVEIKANGETIAILPSTLDIRTPQGVINSFIFDGLIKSKMTTYKGKNYYQPKGGDHIQQKIHLEIFKHYVKALLPKDSYSTKNGLIEILDKELQPSNEETLHRKVTDAVADYFSNDTVIAKPNAVNETNLKTNLIKILNDMGVSIMSIRDYQARFKSKNGNLPPNANALADIANRVVAFKDGGLPIEELTEEVMHLIVETLPQEQIDSLRKFVLASQEYKDHAESYRKVYKGNEKLLEKEILGKILKNITLEKTEGKSQSFLQRLVSIMENFFKNLTIDPKHRQQLKSLNDLVEKLVIQQNGPQFTEDSLKASQEIALMYSLSDKVSEAGETFSNVFKNVTEKRQLKSYSRELKNSNFNDLKGQALQLAVGRFLEMSDRLISTTRLAQEAASKKKKSLSGQNKTILEDLNNQIRKSLNTLATEMEKKQEGIDDTARNTLVARLRENSTEIDRLVEENDESRTEAINEMAEELASQMGEAENEFFKDNLKRELAGDINDINQLFSFFGQLHHASSPVLNLIASKIWDMKMRINQGTKEDMAPFLNSIHNSKLKDRFEELVDHARGFFKGPVKHNAFQATLSILDMEAYIEATETTIEEDSEVDIDKRYDVDTIVKETPYSKEEVYSKLKQLENYKKIEKDMTDEISGRYNTLKKQNQLPYVEYRMNEDYYKEQIARYGSKDTLVNGVLVKGLNISGATQTYLAANSAERNAVKAEAYDNGRFVFTPEQKGNLTDIANIRKSRKSLYEESAVIKSGLQTSIDKPEGDYVELPTGEFLFKTKDFENLSEAEKDIANIAYDLNKIDVEYSKQENTRDKVTNATIQNFLSFLIEARDSGEYSRDDLFDLAISNLDISLSQDFYDTLNGESFLKGDTLLNLNPTPEGRKTVASLKKLYAQRNSILARKRDASSPFEINRVTNEEQKQVQKLSSDISNALKLLTLPDTEVMDSAGEKSANRAYKQALKEKGIGEGTKAELEFLQEHTKNRTVDTVEKAYSSNQLGKPLTKAQTSIIENYKGSLLEVKIAYLKDDLQPYYMRFAPIGYESMQERNDKGESLVSVLTDVFQNDYLDVRIDDSFSTPDRSLYKTQEDYEKALALVKENPYINKDYREDYDGGGLQPKKGKFVDQEFINKFGIDENGNATKDKELYDLHQLYIQTRIKGNENNRSTGANPYKLIQISATGTEKAQKLATEGNKKSTLGAGFKDAISYRVDDKAYGENDFRTTRQVPKYYMSDLENPDDVSSDYIYALTEFMEKSNEYKQRKNTMADIDALHDVLLRAAAKKPNKNDLKNTLSMVNSYIDDAMFGAIESRPIKIKIPGRNTPIDVTKIVRLITRFTSLRNLGFNVVIPITSAATASISKKVEEFIGDKLNKDAARHGDRVFRSMWKDPTKNALDFNDNSKLYLIMQNYGFYGLSEKARNAKYNTMGRTYSKIAMGAHSMSNFMVTPRVVLSILHDNKVITQEGKDTKIQTRQQFIQEGVREGATREEMIAKWNLEDNFIYNHMDFTENGFKWKGEFENGVHKETGLPKTYLDARNSVIQRDMGERVSNIEGQMPVGFRMQAQRHAMMSTILLHKSFLAVNGSNRLRDKHFNVATNMLDEGTWRTAAGVLGEFFNLKDGEKGFKKRVENLRDAMKMPEKSDYTKDGKFDSKAYNRAVLEAELRNRNMKRVGIEMATFASLALIISTAMLLTDDDEDESYFSATANLLMMRTLNESSTNLSLGVLGDIADTVDRPVVIYQSIERMSKVWQLFDFNEIEAGRYRGMNKNTRYLMNLVPGMKNVYDLNSAKNINSARASYELYNKGVGLNVATFGIMPLFDSIKEN